MFGKASKSKKSNDSGWGSPAPPQGGPSGDDFWGGEAAPPSSPPPSSSQRPQAPPGQGPPGRTVGLLDAVEPLFLYICAQHRIAREGKPIHFETVRSETIKRIDVIESQTRRDGVLQQQFERIKDPLLWYIDYWFGSSGEFPSLKEPWNLKRLGEYPEDGDEGSLSGDEAFFDKLDEALKSDAQDEQANERLAFYYIALGLGFTGVYFKAIPEHQEKLRDYMMRLYPRVRKYVDASPSAKITPEAYKFTDKRNFVAPVRDRPFILMAAFLCLLVTLFVGYMYLYGRQKLSLESAVQEILNTEAGSGGSKQ